MLERPVELPLDSDVVHVECIKCLDQAEAVVDISLPALESPVLGCASADSFLYPAAGIVIDELQPGGGGLGNAQTVLAVPGDILQGGGIDGSAELEPGIPARKGALGILVLAGYHFIALKFYIQITPFRK